MEAQIQNGGSESQESKYVNTHEICSLNATSKAAPGIKLGIEASKTPDAHRCENGARALGYILRILEPGLIREQAVLSQLFEVTL